MRFSSAIAASSYRLSRSGGLDAFAASSTLLMPVEMALAVSRILESCSLTSFSPNCMDEMYLQFFLEPEKYMVCFDDSVSFIYKLRPIDKLAKILLDYELATVNPYVQQPRNRPNPFGNPPVNNSNVNSGNSSLVKDRLSQLNSQPLNSNPRSGRKIEVLKKFESFIEEYGLVETSTMILLILIDNDLEFYFKSQKKNQKADDNSNLHKSQKKVQNNPFDFSDISGNQNDPNIAQSQNDLPQNPFNDALNNINFPSDEELDPKVIPEYSFEKVKINSQIINGGKKLLLKLFDYYSADTQVLIFLKSYMEKQEKNAAAGNGGESQKIRAILDALQERGGGNGQIYQIKDRHQFFTYSLYLLLSRFFRLFWEEEIYYICNKVDNSGYKTQCLEANFYETQFSAVFSLIQDLKLKLEQKIMLADAKFNLPNSPSYKSKIPLTILSKSIPFNFPMNLIKFISSCIKESNSS